MSQTSTPAARAQALGVKLNPDGSIVSCGLTLPATEGVFGFQITGGARMYRAPGQPTTSPPKTFDARKQIPRYWFSELRKESSSYRCKNINTRFQEPPKFFSKRQTLEWYTEALGPHCHDAQQVGVTEKLLHVHLSDNDGTQIRILRWA